MHSKSNKLLNVSDCYDRKPSSHQQTTFTTNHYLAPIRRSSSLEFPKTNLSFIESALDSLKNSSTSIYASTLSAAGLLNGIGLDGLRSITVGSNDSADNLYSLMASYRSCCNLFRLRSVTLIISICVCIVTTLILSCLLLEAPFSTKILFSQWQYELIFNPAIWILSFSLLTSLLMNLALITDIHFLILPFIASCVCFLFDFF
ncbi:unnamed protein product [Meloidogyne enterolobii]|uniref:Uncharacterized protein n=1 Tax=Meloidogyne enterolobii TaxID=390850 RepID=A0ACB0Y4C1_MELEN